MSRYGKGGARLYGAEKAPSKSNLKPTGLPVRPGGIPLPLSKTDVAPKEPAVYKIPAFSISAKPKTKAQIEKEKEKVTRRNKPYGEDLPKMHEIVKSLKNKKVTVAEFIGLISPSAADNCDLMRYALAEDLQIFRNATKRIYETMTQDVSDVLTNEHIQVTENSKERHQLYMDKMMRSINEIYHYVADFDFKKYYTDVDYLLDKFPLCPQIDDESDDAQALLRQEAYHRYQWLQSEGGRLKEENTKLQARLNQLKKQQKRAIVEAAEKEKEAEEQKEQLEEKQEELEEKLEELNKSVEKCIVEAEAAVVVEPIVLEKKKKVTEAKGKVPKKKKWGPPSWAEKAAAEIEENVVVEEVKAETSKVSLKSKTSQGKMVKKKKKRKLPPLPPPEESGAFEYTAPKTPPPPPDSPLSKTARTPPRFGEQQRTSPPPQTQRRQSPPRAQRTSPPGTQRTSPPPQQTTTTTTTTVVEETIQQERPRFGRGQAPRDTWGGFG